MSAGLIKFIWNLPLIRQAPWLHVEMYPHVGVPVVKVFGTEFVHEAEMKCCSTIFLQQLKVGRWNSVPFLLITKR